MVLLVARFEAHCLHREGWRPGRYLRYSRGRRNADPTNLRWRSRRDADLVSRRGADSLHVQTRWLGADLRDETGRRFGSTADRQPASLHQPSMVSGRNQAGLLFRRRRSQRPGLDVRVEERKAGKYHPGAGAQHLSGVGSDSRHVYFADSSGGENQVVRLDPVSGQREFLALGDTFYLDVSRLEPDCLSDEVRLHGRSELHRLSRPERRAPATSRSRR